MKNSLKIFDVVVLLVDMHAYKVRVGQVGTVVEELAEDVYEVEFADKQGRTIVSCAVETDNLLKLTYEYAVQ